MTVCYGMLRTAIYAESGETVMSNKTEEKVNLRGYQVMWIVLVLANVIGNLLDGQQGESSFYKQVIVMFPLIFLEGVRAIIQELRNGR